MEIDDPRIRARIPTHATQDTPQTDQPYAYGTVTLCGIPFQRNFRLGWSVCTGGLSTPHVPCGIRFELCRFRSPLLTTSRLISLPPPTEMFQFGGFPIQNGSLLSKQDVPLGNLRIIDSLRLPGAYRSLARPSSALEPSHPLIGLYQHVILMCPPELI